MCQCGPMFRLIGTLFDPSRTDIYCLSFTRSPLGSKNLIVRNKSTLQSGVFEVTKLTRVTGALGNK